MKFILVISVALWGFVTTANAQGLAVGTTTENFSLPDLNGNTQAFEHLKGRNGTVVVFLSAQCPVVKAYKDRINQIVAEAHGKGINFIGINSNATESLKWVKSNTSKFDYRFPILIDKNNKLADSLDARTTPEVFFIDGDNTLLYRGAIDNDYTGRNITESYLAAAFDATLAGGSISITTAPPFGCSIRRGGN